MGKYPLPEDLPSIYLGGRERKLMVTLKDIKVFQGKWKDRDRDSLEAVTELLHMALVHDDPDLTPNDVDEMVHLGNLREVARALARARGQDPDASPLAATGSGTNQEEPTG